MKQDALKDFQGATKDAYMCHVDIKFSCAN
jgi:hypothetical protein